MIDDGLRIAGGRSLERIGFEARQQGPLRDGTSASTVAVEVVSSKSIARPKTAALNSLAKLLCAVFMGGKAFYVFACRNLRLK